MADGLSEYDPFPAPLITPSTKADEGHDEDISADEILSRGLATSEEWAQLTNYTQQLFKKGQDMARAQGLVLADTKYEFGKLPDGTIILIDEVHTPDSSRYFYAESFDKYVSGDKTEKPKHLSKEFVREWLMANGFDGHNGNPLPEMTDEFVTMVSDRYIELYEHVTGQEFVKAETGNIAKRIELNVTNYLETTRETN
jgi:phosphoribosylaminoimidazole-succinocarboxamide synthase